MELIDTHCHLTFDIAVLWYFEQFEKNLVSRFLLPSV